MDDSFGFVDQAGLDDMLSPKPVLRFTARWIDLETGAKLDGVDTGTAEIELI